jgi:hypothetical protein
VQRPFLWLFLLARSALADASLPVTPAVDGVRFTRLNVPDSDCSVGFARVDVSWTKNRPTLEVVYRAAE